jgi:hypothetical protein
MAKFSIPGLKMKSQNEKNYLDISFTPKWDYIPLTRNYIENFLLNSINNKLKITKITLVISELLENAIKYAHDDGIRTMIKKLKNNRKVELRVRNTIMKSEADQLINYIDEVNSDPDPFKFYIEKLKSSITRNDGKIGLGLSRIKYEGEANLSARFFDREDGTGIIEIKAIFNL